MKRSERLGESASVKGTMLAAHLAWARARVPESELSRRLEPAERGLLEHGVLATDWLRLRSLVAIDRAIAAAVGGRAEDVWRELGRHSAVVNLGGAYKGFAADDPHRFFEKQARLHERFQNFGRASYERVAERQGRIRLDEYSEYSPVYCASAIGFYTGALETMRVPGPVRVAETQCRCAGDPGCVVEMSW